jgi:hypothetical protein
MLQIRFTLVFSLFLSISQAQIIYTIAGNGSPGYSGDGGPSYLARIDAPNGIVVDNAGNCFFADLANCRVRKINPTGVITTVAGSGTAGFSGDGGPAILAQLSSPRDVEVDTKGNLFIIDQNNNRVRKVDVNGNISTIAGTGIAGYSGDGGPATNAQVYLPWSVAIDSKNNVYIGDGFNGRIRKIDTNGIISTFAGTGIGGYNGDGGPALSADLNPDGMDFDANDNLYFASWVNGVVRKIAVSGIITTFAGTGLPGYSGDGGPATAAQLYEPIEVTCDLFGNVFISSASNFIRKVNSNGNITTYAGTSVPGYNGDGIPAVSASLNNPYGIATDNSGNLFISDLINARVRTVCFNSCLAGEVELPMRSDIPYVYPNPSNGRFHLEELSASTCVQVLDVTGREIDTLAVQDNCIDLSDYTGGLYFLRLDPGKNHKLVKVIVEK